MTDDELRVELIRRQAEIRDRIAAAYAAEAAAGARELRARERRQRLERQLNQLEHVLNGLDAPVVRDGCENV